MYADTTLYGLYNYNIAHEVIRFKAKSEYLPKAQESFAISIDIVPYDAIISLAWEHTLVSFRLETSTEDELKSYIESQLLAQKEQDADAYIQGAFYLLDHFKELENALLLTDYALKIKDSEYLRNTRADIFVSLNKKDKAIHEIEKAIEMVKDSKDLTATDKIENLKFWNEKLIKLN